MTDAKLEEDVRSGREVPRDPFHERLGREQHAAQCGDRSTRTDKKYCRSRDTDQEQCFAAPAETDPPVPSGTPRRERQRGEQHETVYEVTDRKKRPLSSKRFGGVPGEYEDRADEDFGHDEYHRSSRRPSHGTAFPVTAKCPDH